jgi:hypothetical protein
MAVIANRRVFYDFTFSPPKPVPIQSFIAEDGRIIDAHIRAIWISANELIEAKRKLVLVYPGIPCARLSDVPSTVLWQSQYHTTKLFISDSRCSTQVWKPFVFSVNDAAAYRQFCRLFKLPKLDKLI